MTTPPDWRLYLPALEHYPLLPCGAGIDGKAPLDTATGKPLASWQTARFSPAQINAMNGAVVCCGTRTGPDANGLLVFDLDGASAVQHCRAHGCNPDIQTWRIVRNNAPDRYKIAFQVPPDLWSHLPGKRKHVTGEKEQIEMFFGAGQVIILGSHISSGGHYYWPENCTPADIIEPPPEWWALALAIAGDNNRTPISADPQPALPLSTGSDDLTRAEDAIRALDASMGYDAWIRVGMALHAIDSSAGLAIWDRWSATGTNYAGFKDLEQHWRSFTDTGGVGPGSLFKAAIDAGWQDTTRQPRQARLSGSQPPAAATGGPQPQPSDGPGSEAERKRDLQTLYERLVDAEIDADDIAADLVRSDLFCRHISRERIADEALRRWAHRRGYQLAGSGRSTNVRGRMLKADAGDGDDGPGITPLLPGFINDRELHLLAADAGAGKTWMTLLMAQAAGLGSNGFLDQGAARQPSAEDQRRTVLYIASDGEAGAYSTICDYAEQLGITATLDQWNLEIWAQDDPSGERPWSVRIPDLDRLADRMTDGDICLVIIDTAKSVFEAANVSVGIGPVGTYLRVLREIVCRYCALWINHHTNRTGRGLKAVGSHPAFQEVPSAIHRLECVQREGQSDARKWVVEKLRGGSQRTFQFEMAPDGPRMLSGTFFDDMRRPLLGLICDRWDPDRRLPVDPELSGTTPGALFAALQAAGSTNSRQSVYNALSMLRQQRLVRPRGKGYRPTAAGLRACRSISDPSGGCGEAGHPLPIPNTNTPVDESANSIGMTGFCPDHLDTPKRSSDETASNSKASDPMIYSLKREREGREREGIELIGASDTNGSHLESIIESHDEKDVRIMGNMPEWLPQLIALRQQQPHAAAAALALALDPSGTGQPSGREVKHWLPTADQLIAEGEEPSDS